MNTIPTTTIRNIISVLRYHGFTQDQCKFLEAECPVAMATQEPISVRELITSMQDEAGVVMWFDGAETGKIRIMRMDDEE